MTFDWGSAAVGFSAAWVLSRVYETLASMRQSRLVAQIENRARFEAQSRFEAQFRKPLPPNTGGSGSVGVGGSVGAGVGGGGGTVDDVTALCTTGRGGGGGGGGDDDFCFRCGISRKHHPYEYCKTFRPSPP